MNDRTEPQESRMSRVQLALNVTDVDAAVDFYSKLFRTEPAKRRPGYANFAIAEPPLKLVLIESSAEAAGTLNHLGVEVASTDEVTAAQSRLEGDGLDTAAESGTCCYAVQEKVWVNDPDGAPWEIYTVLADADTMANQTTADTCGAGACATTELTESVKGCC
jgi:catechol 2,3-dioxygenase-like lactoylglutathione lyase family enzyme